VKTVINSDLITKVKPYFLVVTCWACLYFFVFFLGKDIVEETEFFARGNHALHSEIIPEPSINCTKVKEVAWREKLFDSTYKFHGDGQKKRRSSKPHKFSEISDVESWTDAQHRVWDEVKVNLYRYGARAERSKMVRLLRENVLTDAHVRIYKYCEEEDVFVDEWLDGEGLTNFRVCTKTPNFLARLRLLISIVQSVVDLNKRGIIYLDYKWTQWRQTGRDTKNVTHKFKMVDLEVKWFDEWNGWDMLYLIYKPEMEGLVKLWCPSRGVEWCSPYEMLRQSNIEAPSNMTCIEQYGFVHRLLLKRKLPIAGQKSKYKAFQLQSLTFLTEVMLVPGSKMNDLLRKKFKDLKCTWDIPEEVKDEVEDILGTSCDLVNGPTTYDFLMRLKRMEKFLSQI